MHRNSSTKGIPPPNFGGHGRPYTSKKTAQPRGLFSNGVWHCDCKPRRLPAEHFRVKKEGKNKGRWFFTCQLGEGQRCGFFLWEDDAKPREEAVVLGNTRSEPGSLTTDDVMRDGDQARHVDGDTVKNSVSEQLLRRCDDDTKPPELPDRGDPAIGVRYKRPRSQADFGATENDIFIPPSAGEEHQPMSPMADGVGPETPRKSRKIGVYDTPVMGTGRMKSPWPSSPGNTEDDPITTPSLRSASYIGSANGKEDPPMSSGNIDTPSSRDKIEDAPSSLINDVMNALCSSGTTLPSKTMAGVRAVLERYDLRMQGVIKGRDISRLAVKVRDAKIVELQARIATLEAEREVDRAMRQVMRREREAHP